MENSTNQMRMIGRFTMESCLSRRTIETLNNKVYLVLLSLFLFSCTKSTTEPYEEKKAGSLHTPAWIQGKWINKRNHNLILKFTDNDYLVIDGANESSQLGGYFITDVTDNTSGSTYTISYKDAGNNWTYRFEMEQDTFLYSTTIRDSSLLVLREPYIK